VVIVGIVAAIGAGWLLTRRAGQVLLRSASAS
jgi:type II secretory pathway pseudopilin PulG